VNHQRDVAQVEHVNELGEVARVMHLDHLEARLIGATEPDVIHGDHPSARGKPAALERSDHLAVGVRALGVAMDEQEDRPVTLTQSPVEEEQLLARIGAVR
jgi:hypothetical protein